MAVDEGTPATAVDTSADGQLVAQRDAPVGGQAVLEGVMMRGVSAWAVALRVPSDEQLAAIKRGEVRDRDDAALGDIEVHLHRLTSVLVRRPALRLPVLRGVVALGESMSIGFKALSTSVNTQLGEKDEEISGPMWIGTVALALLMSVGLFFVIPVGLTSLVKGQLGSPLLFWLVEGVLRTAIFLGYLIAVSRVRDLRRLFEYHGAEHKTISCYEAGLDLTPQNAQKFSRLHPRCGTSFLLIVMIVAIFAFAPVGLPAWYWLLATRILGVPLIAGLSFEIIKLTGRHRRTPIARAIMWPGMQLQKLTTREPDLDQLAVAIAAMEAVLETQSDDAEAGDLLGVEVVA